MRIPSADPATWRYFPAIDSTQNAAIEAAKREESCVVWAGGQTEGRGRFGRTWHSEPGASLAISISLVDYANTPLPHLVGMSAAVAAAGAIKSELRWPNDLVFGVRKVGGILTELVTTESGMRIPVVGIGINLNQIDFPNDISETATSLKRELGREFDALKVASGVLSYWASLPEPTSWRDLEAAWDVFDRTPGKVYRLSTGEIAYGLGVGSDGQLLCSVDGESRSVLAAEALFGEVWE